MPTVTVNRDVLYQRLNNTYTEEEFENLCFDFGIELDDIVEEDKVTKFKIDIPANRYDLLCVEGLANGLNVFLQNTKTLPKYTVQQGKDRLIVDKSVSGVRPFCVAAILRGINFNEEVYNSFILLQDKLHQNIGRERSLVSIGTHDLDTINGPFKYQALPPNEIKFVPLNQSTSMTAPEMFDVFRQNYLKPYLQIIEGSPVYPLITDANSTVLSLPPIINGDHSKISLNTKNILIEVTAKDRKKAGIVLDTICAAFSEYCSLKYTIEAVQICYDNETFYSPKMGYRTEEYSSQDMCRKIGVVDLSANQIASLLTKMCLCSTSNGDKVTVEIGPTRHDILHQCDIEEDVAIAYGYNNIAKMVPNIYTIACEQEVNKLSDALREELARCNFTEVLTFSLCSRDDVSVNLKKAAALKNAVHISNPKTYEFQVLRTTLLPGILKTVSCNRSLPLPIKLFEVSDVVLRDDFTETQTKNYRYVTAVHCGKSSGFEIVHGLLDRLMLMLSITDYRISPTSDEMFFPGRGADILLGSEKIGHVGIIHPEVLEKFDVNLSCSVLEFKLEPLI